MNRIRHALVIVLVSFASLFVSPMTAAEDLACDSGANGTTKDVCYIDVTVDVTNTVATPNKDPITFYKLTGNKVTIVWRVANPESNYAFRADGIWLPVYANTNAFDKPACQTATPQQPDQQHCEQNPLAGQIYFVWTVKKGYKTSLAYTLKLYPLNKNATQVIEVKAKIGIKADKTPIWGDPTIVIQG